jgi:hypothetical protein
MTESIENSLNLLYLIFKKAADQWFLSNCKTARKLKDYASNLSASLSLIKSVPILTEETASHYVFLVDLLILMKREKAWEFIRTKRGAAVRIGDSRSQAYFLFCKVFKLVYHAVNMMVKGQQASSASIDV